MCSTLFYLRFSLFFIVGNCWIFLFFCIFFLLIFISIFSFSKTLEFCFAFLSVFLFVWFSSFSIFYISFLAFFLCKKLLETHQKPSRDANRKWMFLFLAFESKNIFPQLKLLTIQRICHRCDTRFRRFGRFWVKKLHSKRASKNKLFPPSKFHFIFFSLPLLQKFLSHSQTKQFYCCSFPSFWYIFNFYLSSFSLPISRLKRFLIDFLLEFIFPVTYPSKQLFTYS